MPKYLFYGTYTPEGYRGLMAEGGSVRIDVSRRALGSVGGSLEAFYYSNGKQDFYIIVNLPDHVTATAVTLLTPEEMDRAVRLKVDFRPPGYGAAFWLNRSINGPLREAL